MDQGPWADHIALARIESAGLDPGYLAGSLDAKAREAAKIVATLVGYRRNLTFNAGFWEDGVVP